MELERVSNHLLDYTSGGTGSTGYLTDERKGSQGPHLNDDKYIRILGDPIFGYRIAIED
jgi:hypothetical protein